MSSLSVHLYDALEHLGPTRGSDHSSQTDGSGWTRDRNLSRGEIYAPDVSRFCACQSYSRTKWKRTICVPFTQSSPTNKLQCITDCRRLRVILLVWQSVLAQQTRGHTMRLTEPHGIVPNYRGTTRSNLLRGEKLKHWGWQGNQFEPTELMVIHKQVD